MTRSSTTDRGYGTKHRALRKQWQPIVDAGDATCAKCGKGIAPGTPWDLGHTADRTAYTGPECRRCNRSDGARRGNAMRQPRVSQLRW